MIIEPTYKVESVRVVEADISAASLTDIANKYEISERLLVNLLDNYFSAEDLHEIEAYIRTELDADYYETLTEEVDLSTDALMDKVSDTELKNMVKDAGVELKGNETKDELKGMAKALSTTESTQKTEGGFLPGHIGGYKADVYMKLEEEIDVDTLASTIENALVQCAVEPLSKASVTNVSITQLPKSVFESRKLSKFLK